MGRTRSESNDVCVKISLRFDELAKEAQLSERSNGNLAKKLCRGSASWERIRAWWSGILARAGRLHAFARQNRIRRSREDSHSASISPIALPTQPDEEGNAIRA